MNNCIELAEHYRKRPDKYREEVLHTPGMREYVLCRAYQQEMNGIRPTY